MKASLSLKFVEILLHSLEINSHISCCLRLRALQFYIFVRLLNEFQFSSIFLQSEMIPHLNRPFISKSSSISLSGRTGSSPLYQWSLYDGSFLLSTLLQECIRICCRLCQEIGTTDPNADSEDIPGAG